MKEEIKKSLGSFLIELIVYSVLVVAYFLFVLHFLADPLASLFQHKRKIYAVVSLLLIIGQGVILELLTSMLLRVIRRGREEE